MPVSTTEDIETMSVLKAAKITGMSRNTLSAAMDRYEITGGRDGLPYVVLATRRLIVRASLRRWFERLERRVIGRG